MCINRICALTWNQHLDYLPSHFYLLHSIVTYACRRLCISRICDLTWGQHLYYMTHCNLESIFFRKSWNLESWILKCNVENGTLKLRDDIEGWISGLNFKIRLQPWISRFILENSSLKSKVEIWNLDIAGWNWRLNFKLEFQDSNSTLKFNLEISRLNLNMSLKAPSLMTGAPASAKLEAAGPPS